MTQEPTPMPKECSNCRKVTVCKLYEDFVGMQQAWDEKHGGLIKFPLNPVQLATVCKEYENPTQVIKITNNVELA